MVEKLVFTLRFLINVLFYPITLKYWIQTPNAIIY